ncbi:RNA-directed DNA polymerase from mobile element jockey [Trichonephila clavipes]|uniref:RNA-directed DNA polymerase from mobile element jockey n=1 Tax=Trichonephila clavipes TaxID=2585209 RepID=A0A8X6SXX5_TRICX|nr:RNA-directed DNA polymerase from mobile element jockey [Trichonephila clavipes]
MGFGSFAAPGKKDRVVVYSASTSQVWGSINGLRKVDSAFHPRYIGSINEYQACLGSYTLKVSLQTDHQIGTSVPAPQRPMNLPPRGLNQSNHPRTTWLPTLPFDDTPTPKSGGDDKIWIQEAKIDCHRPTVAGVAQGTLISPLLFNIYVNDIPKHDNTILCMFADDTEILATRKEPKLIARALNRHILDLEDWFTKWKIALNVAKKEAVFFTRKHSLTNP